jgi:hypothetical protein
MTAASDGGAQQGIAHVAGGQARQSRHPHRIVHAQIGFFGAAAPVDPLLGPETLGPFSPRSRAEKVAADGSGCGP